MIRKSRDNKPSRPRRKERFFHTKSRFPDRTKEKGWEGPIADYKEIELLRKFLTSSSKMMSRKRAGTSAEEQRSLKTAIKHARFMALIAYKGI